MVRLLLALSALLLIASPSVAAEKPKMSVKMSTESEVQDLGKLRTHRVGKDGFLAEFVGAKPGLARTCSGSCDNRWSGSWTCGDNQSCYLNCGSPNPAQCN